MLSIGRLVQIFCNVDPRARRCSGPLFFFFFFCQHRPSDLAPLYAGKPEFAPRVRVQKPLGSGERHDLAEGRLPSRWRAVTAPSFWAVFSAAQIDVSTAENQPGF